MSQMKTISFDNMQKVLHDFIDDMSGDDIERFLEREFYVENVNYNVETDEVEFESTDNYNGELDYAD